MPTHQLRNLVNIVDRASWQPMPCANCDNLVKPSIFRGTCFELRADAEVILARIDRLTARKALHHFGRPMAHALISHEYQLFIIRPQGHPHIREDDAISSNEHCIRPARENRAFEAWPFKFAAFNRINKSLTRRCVTDLEWLGDATSKREEKF